MLPALVCAVALVFTMDALSARSAEEICVAPICISRPASSIKFPLHKSPDAVRGPVNTCEPVASRYAIVFSVDTGTLAYNALRLFSAG